MKLWIHQRAKCSHAGKCNTTEHICTQWQAKHCGSRCQESDLPWFRFFKERDFKIFFWNTDGQEAGLSSWAICSPILPHWDHFPCPGHTKGNTRHSWMCCWQSQAQGAEPRPGGCSRLGQSPPLVGLTLCILPLLRELTAQILHSAKHTWNIQHSTLPQK